MRTTEQSSNYHNLQDMSVKEILTGINNEDSCVPVAVAEEIPQIEKLVEGIVERLKRGGRVFYLGAGTSGRLGVVDASEIPPTYGVSDKFIGLIAGGDKAIRNAVEAAEDSNGGGWKDMQPFSPTADDVVVGVAASGSTPYVIGAVKIARERGLLTGCITCNKGSELAAVSEIPVEVVVGPEFVTGSTRMKAGTAEKLVLNMISTATMIRLGHVKGNKMVDMQLTNKKLVDRGSRMIMGEADINDYKLAKRLLLKYGSVRKAVDAIIRETRMRSEKYPSELLENAVEAISSLPGVGEKSALRLALHLLKQPVENVRHFTDSIRLLRENVRYCRTCMMISDDEQCSICSDNSRDHNTICVVENVRDVMSVEATGQYHGIYHVLGGKISPIDGIGPSDLKIIELKNRVEALTESGVEPGNIEIILALSGDVEGETTSFYIYRQISAFGIKVSSPARGLGFGDDLEYADQLTLGRSIVNRQLFRP